MEEVLKFLKEAGVYYLATVEDNKPKVRPFGTIEIYDNHLYIQTGMIAHTEKNEGRSCKNYKYRAHRSLETGATARHVEKDQG